MGDALLKKDAGARFTKVYQGGFERILTLVDNDPSALKIWAFLVKHAERNNVVVCSMKVLEDELGLTRQTISKKVKYLVERGAMRLGKIGTANVYILNPEETSKTAEWGKTHVGVKAKTLIGFNENQELCEKLKGEWPK